MHESLLVYKNYRYAVWALILTALCSAIYLSHNSAWVASISSTFGNAQVPNGGTWQGYTLGTIATLLIIWLTALGIRKRRYSSSLGKVQDWTSAHVYLGLATLVIATLHSAGQLGWNVHSLAYVLMSVVIISGIIGVYAYIRYPQLMASNRAGRTTADMFSELNALNQSGHEIAKVCEPTIMQAVETSIARTTIGGGLWAQLFARDNSLSLLPQKLHDHNSAAGLVSNKDQQAIILFVADSIPRTRKKSEASELQKLLTILCRRQTILRQLRRDIQLKAGLQLWLLIHIPATIALLASLTIHIISVFFFW